MSILRLKGALWASLPWTMLPLKRRYQLAGQGEVIATPLNRRKGRSQGFETQLDHVGFRDSIYLLDFVTDPRYHVKHKIRPRRLVDGLYREFLRGQSYFPHDQSQ